MNDTFHTRMLLTTAVIAAVAALLTGTASAHVLDVEGGGGSGGATVTPQPAVEPGTIPYLSHGIGVDQSQFSGRSESRPASGFGPAMRSALAARDSERNVERALTEKGLEIVGRSLDGKFVEIIELPSHPWYVAVQFHPEFKSKPLKAHPLFAGFVAASHQHKVDARRQTEAVAG